MLYSIRYAQENYTIRDCVWKRGLIMNIVVLAGGTSTERDISILTSTKVCESLRRNGYNANIVDVFIFLLHLLIYMCLYFVQLRIAKVKPSRKVPLISTSRKWNIFYLMSLVECYALRHWNTLWNKNLFSKLLAH